MLLWKNAKLKSLDNRSKRSFIFLIIISFCVCSCAYTPVKKAPKEDTRTIEILLLLEEASINMEREVGLRLKVKNVRKIKFNERNPDAMISQMRQQSAGESFDIAVAVVPRVGSVGDALMGALIGGWQGFIDDSERRYVIVKGLDPWVVTHEIYHSFLLSHDHGFGQMSAVRLCILPYGHWCFAFKSLSDKDRAEIIRNKWRKMNGAILTPISQRGGS